MSYAATAIIVGLIEVSFGRQLFWLFAAIGGFVVGWFTIPEIYPTVTGNLHILAGVGIALVFGLLAHAYRRLMVAIAGFFIFSGAAVLVGRDEGALLANGSASYWFVYGVAGAVSAMLLFSVTDWALIVLSSIAGAGAVAGGAIHLLNDDGRGLKWVVFAVLAIAGIVFQVWRYTGESDASGLARRRRKKVKTTPRRTVR
jgi:hypothetical protein